MGQTLSEPVTTKESHCAKNEFYKVGLSCMQGWRVSMEDSHTVLLSIPEDPDAAFFGVFDGHGGAKIADYTGKHLYKHVIRQPDYECGAIKEAIEEGFMELDTKMRDDKNLRHALAGTTAVVVLIKENKLYCGNAGDSRAIAYVKDAVLPLSSDHKPMKENEYQRIREAGGWVEFNRVNGNLAVSRALGDYAFKNNKKKSAKEQAVTAFPDVTIHDLNEDWKFLVLACDGIWDVMTNEEVAEFVKERLNQEMEPEVICEQLMNRCLAPDSRMGGLGCDNMTVLIIIFTKYNEQDD